jgi:hypothetical protein
MMTVFRVGEQEVKVWRDRSRWAVAVNGAVQQQGFLSEARAAGAGLLRAQRLDIDRRRAHVQHLAAASPLRPTG